MSKALIPYTEFGGIIKEIYQNPDLPVDVLPESKITREDHQALVNKWQNIILRKTHQGAKNGLSIDSFIKLVNEFYGFETNMNRSLLDRLIHTGNPHRENYAKALRKDILKIVCNFTNKYSFDQLLKLGQKTLGESETIFIQSIKESIKTDPRTFDRSPSDDSLKNIVENYINENGYQDLIKNGISATDLLEILFNPSPKVSFNTFAKLPSLLGINNDDFINLIKKDID